MSADILSTPWVCALSAMGLALVSFIAIVGMGSWLSREDYLETAGIGLALQGFLFGSLALIGIPLKVLTFGVFCIGLWGLRRFKVPIFFNYASIANKPLWAKVTLILLVTLIVSRLFFALYPQLQADPLSYHVTSAKVWAENNNLLYIHWLPWALQGGAFEYFYTLIATLYREPTALRDCACRVDHLLHCRSPWVI